MKLLLQRRKSGANATIGSLSIDGVFECNTLEDVERAEKVFGKTAIPPGIYKVVLTHSLRFKRILPLLENVPGFSGVRIHPGNTAEDTEGCILPGQWNGGESVSNSRKAFEALYKKLEQAQDIEIEVRSAAP